MKFSKFLTTYEIGKSYPAPDGTYKGECVSLVKCYIKDVLGVTPQSIGDAKQYWLKRKEKYIKSLFKPLKKGAKLQKGDVFVRTSGTYGHIGIVQRAEKDGFISIEQNNGGCRVVKWMRYPLTADFHYLRPLNQENICNKPSVKPGDSVRLNANNFLYLRANKDEKLKICDVSNFKCDKDAQLKKGTKVSVLAVDTVKGDIWLKIKVNGIECYILAYSKKKDKSYIKA